ncbi:MAG TPA: FtsX-like permease family protein, partial [Blastocatellia bacterium]|nr:FtsX-like permease family protein [Blastocatellia bacterium]
GLAGAIKEGGRGAGRGVRGRRVRDWLIVGQVAVSFMLLIGAGLMLRSLLRLQEINPGFNPESVLVMRISPNWSKLTTPEQYRKLYKQLIERMQSQPGVVSTAIASTFPLNPTGTINNIFYRNFQIEGRPIADGEIAPRADFRNVSPDYFQTIRMPLIKGRTFTEGDDEKSPQVALINQSMARHRWGDEDPVGKRVSFDGGRNWVEIVGVVGDVKQYGLSTDPTDEMYVPLAQNPGGGYLLARAAMEPMSLALAARSAIHEVDSETAVTNVQTLEQVKSESLASPRLTTLLLGLFALVALTITATGIAGVMALSVNQRKHELGIRMALGATQGKVLGMVLRQGMTMVMIGLALGLVGALLLTRVLSSLLFAVEPTDPLTYLAVSLVLAGVAGISCFVPARKVTSIDPMIALRSE